MGMYYRVVRHQKEVKVKVGLSLSAYITKMDAQPTNSQEMAGNYCNTMHVTGEGRQPMLRDGTNLWLEQIVISDANINI